MPEPNWWEGVEAVQIVGHSAYGGAVPIIFGLMDVTAELGMRPVILATHPDVVSAAKSEGRTVWEFPGIQREARPLRDLITAVMLAKALRVRKVKIVHTHTSKGGMVGRLAARLAGCRLVIHHTHGFYHSGMPPGVGRSLMLALERFFGRLDERQVFINSDEFDHAVHVGISRPDQARLCFNGIDRPATASMEVDAVRDLYGLPRNAALVGSVCRIDFEQKGLDVGLRAFRQVAEELPAAEWVIAGTGDDLTRLQCAVQDAGLADAVHLLGAIEQGGNLHRAFDVMFAPSRREGQSVTMMEAMAAGTAIVTTAIPGTVDLAAPGVSAMLVAVDDVAGMADAVVELLTNEPKRRRMGEASRARFESTFTKDSFLVRARELYLDALGVPSASQPVLTWMRRAHVDGVVNVHIKSFPGFFLTQLGSRFLRTYYSHAIRDRDSLAILAIARGSVVGFVVGSVNPQGFYRRLLRRHWWSFSLAAIPAIFKDARIVGRVARATKKPGESAKPEGAAAVFSLAVSPETQGTGVGSALLEKFAEAARQRGCRSVRLETDASQNSQAIAFYRRNGFVAVDEYTTPEGRRMLEYELPLQQGNPSQ